MINERRVEDRFSYLAKIGQQENGGITRLAFSDEDWEARSFILQQMEDAGLKIRIDDFGNVVGRREGIDPDAPIVMLGSHVDSVPSGGNYDGIVGVLAAIEVLKSMEEDGNQNIHPIEVVVFMAEESSRFGVATLGSKAFCGKLSQRQIESYRDKDGISLAEALRHRGLNTDDVAKVRYLGFIKSFLELHIEQGKVLEATHNQIGIVTGIAAPSRYKMIVTGEADHSGATPMTMRRDALAAAAEIVLMVEKLALKEASTGVVGTTGVIKAEPGAMNVIPGKVEMGVDIRGITLESKHRVVTALMSAIEELKDRRNVGVEVIILTDEPPVQLSDEMVSLLSDIASQQKRKAILMPSGAGHDAMHLANLVPTGMIFIPCRRGISHNPAEFAAMDDIIAGTNILLAAVYKLAGVKERG